MLPKTTPDHYLTGMTALNIPLPEEGYGDWHFNQAFYGRGKQPPKIFVAGTGEDWNTNPIWGNFGIYACEAILKKAGLPIADDEKVFAAGHYRAVLDMLYRCLKKGNYPFHLDLDPWFETAEQKAVVLEKANDMLPFLPSSAKDELEKWIQSQR